VNLIDQKGARHEEFPDIGEYFYGTFGLIIASNSLEVLYTGEVTYKIIGLGGLCSL
jgi:hypothetical protein